jgi:hypothetical protein
VRQEKKSNKRRLERRERVKKAERMRTDLAEQ